MQVRGGRRKRVLHLPSEPVEHVRHFRARLINRHRRHRQHDAEHDLIGLGQHDVGGGVDVGEDGERHRLADHRSGEEPGPQFYRRQLGQGKRRRQAVGREGKEQRDQHDGKEPPLIVQRHPDQPQPHHQAGGDQVVGQPDPLLAAEDFRKDPHRKSQADAQKENDEHAPELVMVRRRDAEPADDLPRPDQHQGHDHDGHSEIEIENGAEHAAEFVPLPLH